MIKKLFLIAFLASFFSTYTLFANHGKKHGHHHHPPFKLMDTNNDGKISKDEWMAKFKEMDANKDGFITKEEMKKHHKEMMKKHHEEMEKHMDEHEDMKK